MQDNDQLNIINSVPGNSSYSDVTKSGKNIKLMSDSIPRGLRMREFNNLVKGGKTQLKAFPGATAKRLHHYILPTLEEDKPDIVIIHVGCNDISPNNENVDVKLVGEEILSIGKTCLKHGVEKVFISSIVCNRNFMKQKLINNLNEYIRENCEKQGFIFIDHSQITSYYLCKDGTHLQESGKIILANNYIDILNDFLYHRLDFIRPK